MLNKEHILINATIRPRTQTTKTKTCENTKHESQNTDHKTVLPK